MRVLGIDTSCSTGSVALVEAAASPYGAEVVASATARVSNAHGESLLPLVEAVLRAGNSSLAEVDLLAVGVGPGSFTGTRIGVATAKGLALGADKPLLGVSSFEAIALDTGAPEGTEVLVVLDARKAEVYAAVVALGSDDACLATVAVHAAPSLALEAIGRKQAPLPPFVAGDGVELVATIAPLSLRHVGARAPRAEAVAALAGARFLRGAPDQAETLEPFYVRPPDITLPTRPSLAVGRPRDP